MLRSVLVLAALGGVVVVHVGCGAPASADPAVDDYVGLTEAHPEGPGAAKPPTTLGADASVQPQADAAPDAPACDVHASSTQFRCSADGMSRARCTSSGAIVEPCSRGCLREAASTDDVCMGTSTSWSCPGSYGTTKASNGDYYITAFGCWKDAAGVSHGDSGDNCIPSCLAQAKSAGLCMPGDTGKQCEERVTWYTADAARFGCLARVKVTNPANGKSVVAVALDFGPACGSVESRVQKAVLDASGRVDR